MSTLNSYATLTELQNYIVSRGNTPVTDATNDSVMEGILEAASRYIEDETGREFYPSVFDNLYDIPLNSRELPVADLDLLELLSFVNGDGSAIPTTEFQLIPNNVYPKYALKLKPTSLYYWLPDTTGGNEAVLEAIGIKGFHDNYVLAWRNATTLSAQLNSTDLTFNVPSVSLLHAGKIIRIGNEIMNVSAIGTLAGGVYPVTVLQRGDNGSTAASHDAATLVKFWKPMDTVKEACIQIAHNTLREKSGAGNQQARVTAAGVVLTPMGIPDMAQDIIVKLRKR